MPSPPGPPFCPPIGVKGTSYMRSEAEGFAPQYNDNTRSEAEGFAPQYYITRETFRSNTLERITCGYDSMGRCPRTKPHRKLTRGNPYQVAIEAGHVHKSSNLRREGAAVA